MSPLEEPSDDNDDAVNDPGAGCAACAMVLFNPPKERVVVACGNETLIFNMHYYNLYNL